ncbi:MAG TPA: methyltransferase domain-containing protein [Baekduia sp.]|nr:methyltransferase domain-containing protein [Baekduia sp.]
MTAADPDEHRRASRERWEAAAAGWARRREGFHAALLPVSEWMVDAVAPQPGAVLVELAAGLGDTGLLAVQRAQPGGRLLCTDGAQAMLDAAKEHARELGLDHLVEFRPMELEWLDLSAATVDAVLCRFGYMLALDPAAALRETRRVLKSEGRVALAVWDSEEHNPFSLGAHLVRLGHAAPPAPGEPGPFALSDADALLELVAGAGLFDAELERVDVTFRAPSLDALWEQQRDLSPRAREIVPRLSPAEHTHLRDAVDAAWAPHVQPDGSVALPGRVLCVAASA